MDVLVQYHPRKNLPEEIHLVVDRGEALSYVLHLFFQDVRFVEIDKPFPDVRHSQEVRVAGG